MGWLSRRKKTESGEVVGETSTAEAFIDRTGTSDDRNLNLAVSVHNWQVAWRLTFALAALSVVFNGYHMLQSKYIPVVVAIDEIGQKIVVGPVTDSKPVNLDRAVYREIKDFIEFSRWVSSDAIYQKRVLQHVASRIRVNSKAARMIGELHTVRPPYDTGKVNTISVENVVPLKQSDKTYGVEWTEVRRTLAGEVLTTERWKALVSVSLDPLDDRESVLLNPLGFFVDDIDWSKVR